MDHRLIPWKIKWGETYPPACNLASKTILGPTSWAAWPAQGRLRDLADLLTAELELVQSLVKPSLSKELAVTPPLPDLSMLHHHDLVGMKNGAQPMSHHDTGPPRHELRD